MEGKGGMYGSDDVDVAGNERRCDVGDGEVGNTEHDEIIERIARNGGEALQDRLQDLANLNHSTRILFVLHNLQSKGRVEITFTTAFTVSSWFS